MNAPQTGAHNLWGNHPIPPSGETRRLDIGPLTIWIKAVKNELWIASARDDEATPGDGEGRSEATPPGDLDWSRWALKKAPQHLRITPVFSDAPLVVKPEHPFTILRYADARIYMRVPIWVRIEVSEENRGRGTLLTEIPTQPLSETWWGDFLDGELGYWLSTSARREIRDEHFEPHLVICAVHLTNKSEDDLPVEKLAFRVEHLSIYDDDGKLWAEEVRVDYHGEAEGSEIHMIDRPPVEAAEATELSPARTQTRSLRARTFARLRALSGWGS